jgi:glycosyltransferase involved in cell wall biosynthesis
MSIRVVHISGTKLSSGAGRGTLWLHQGLLSLGVDSFILAQEAGDYASDRIVSLVDGFFGWARQRALPRIDRLPAYRYPLKNKRSFSPGWLGNNLSHHPLVQSADLINLHWVNNGMLGIDNIAQFRQPVVWTVRDMWPFTGGCHYSLSCEKYTTTCGACPVLGSSRTRDLSTARQHKKLGVFGQLPLTWAPISPWIGESLKASAVFRPHHGYRQIMNCVDTEQFYPESKPEACRRLGIPKGGKKVVLCGAIGIHAPYKGFSLFRRAMEQLWQSDEGYLFVFFGGLDQEMLQGFEGDYLSLGYLDNEKLRLAYSAADLFVIPSIQEAFGKTLVEAMACGTPGLSIAETGPGDLVEHERSGIRVESPTPNALMEGIKYFFALPAAQRNEMGEEARRQALSRFSPEKIAGQYLELYQETIAKAR